MSAPVDLVDDLLRYIEASPTPYHAVRETARRLEAARFARFHEGESWRPEPGSRGYVVRAETSICAFVVGAAPPAHGGFRIIGSHTDSPNLRVKPSPELVRSGCHQLGVEIYGGVLFSTWLDRDLSLAGRIAVQRSPTHIESHLVDFARPLLRIPNLAIHLNRMVNIEGLILNAQQHMVPIIGLELEGAFDLRQLVVEQLARGGVEAAATDILGWDLCAYDVQPPVRSGIRGELIHAPRIDNLESCHAALTALLDHPTPHDATRVVVLYDHEECGSRSAQGAASPFLRSVLERICARQTREEPDAMARAMSKSFLVSTDMAHAVHPNYADRHEPLHQPVLGRGPVIKVNVNQAYATDGETYARFVAACRSVDVAPQTFVVRTDLPCGSTIGPITAAELGIRTVDVGNPMLSMHSCREMAAASDVPRMIAALGAFFAEPV